MPQLVTRPVVPFVAQVLDSAEFVVSEREDELLEGRHYHEDAYDDVIGFATVLVRERLRAHWAELGYEMVDVPSCEYVRLTDGHDDGAHQGTLYVPPTGTSWGVWDVVAGDITADEIEEQAWR